MALSVPAHRIQGVFGSPSWSSLAGASHAHESMAFNAMPNTTSRGRVNLAVLAARTAVASQQSSPMLPQTPVVTRPRRSSVRSVAVPVSIRRAPPPPPPRAAISHIEDPFADAHAPQDFLAQALPPPRAASRAAAAAATPSHAPQPQTTYIYSSSAPIRAQRDDQRTAKLVANVLLSRANGRPMRRRLPQSPEEKTYVRSGLSRMVEVEC